MGRIAKKIVAAVLLLGGFVLLYLAYFEQKPFAEAQIRRKAVAEAAVSENTENPLYREINFTMLQGINPDIIGWLYAPQIGVDQPVLQGADDLVYLNTDFEGNDSPSGSVFTWADADRYLSDSHICLFAHNLPSGQMFGKLDLFQDESFLEENRTLYLYTPKDARELEVYSAYECHKEDQIFQDSSGRTAEHADCQTVTLATCAGYGQTEIRFVVNCRVENIKVVL